MDQLNVFVKTLLIALLRDEDFKNSLQPIINAAIQDAWEKINAKTKSKQFLSLTEAAQMLSVSKATIHTWCKRGVIERKKVAGSNVTFFKMEDIDNVLRTIRPYRKN